MSLALSALRSFSGRNHEADELGLDAQGLVIFESCFKAFLECIEMQFGNVVVGDEDVGRRWEGVNDSFGDVGNQMKATVDGILSKNGYFDDIRPFHVL